MSDPTRNLSAIFDEQAVKLVATIDPKSMAAIRSMYQDPDQLKAFVRQDRHEVIGVLKNLSISTEPDKDEIVCTILEEFRPKGLLVRTYGAGVVYDRNREITKVAMQIVENLSAEYQARALSSIGSSLATGHTARRALKVLADMEPAVQTEILTEPYNHFLTGRPELMDILENLDANRQTAILTTKGSDKTLNDEDCSRRVITIIQGLSSEQQTEILCMVGFIAAPANYGQADATMEIIRALSPDQQSAVLDAAGSAGKYYLEQNGWSQERIDRYLQSDTDTSSEPSTPGL